MGSDWSHAVRRGCLWGRIGLQAGAFQQWLEDHRAVPPGMMDLTSMRDCARLRLAHDDKAILLSDVLIAGHKCSRQVTRN